MAGTVAVVAVAVAVAVESVDGWPVVDPEQSSAARAMPKRVATSAMCTLVTRNIPARLPTTPLHPPSTQRTRLPLEVKSPPDDNRKIRRMRLRRFLYRAARTANDVEAITSGDPRRMRRRLKNKVLGRLLAPFWRKLWR